MRNHYIGHWELLYPDHLIRSQINLLFMETGVMKKTLQIIAVAAVAGSALLASMPTQAFFGPMHSFTNGWGPWGGGYYPYYGGYYPYYGGYYPYYGGYYPYYGGYPAYGYPLYTAPVVAAPAAKAATE